MSEDSIHRERVVVNTVHNHQLISSSEPIRRWHVAYTKMHHERKVRDELLQNGIEAYVAVRTESRQWSDRIKKKEVVILPMYLFVKVSREEQRQVLEHPSVSRYLCLRGEHKPAVIPEDQMEQFRFMLDYSEETVQMLPEELVHGQRVRVMKGPLKGLEGEYVNFEGKYRIVLKIDYLGSASVTMPPGFVEALK